MFFRKQPKENNEQRDHDNFSEFLLSIISINLLAFYHECRSLIGYATHYLFSCKNGLAQQHSVANKMVAVLLAFSKCLCRRFI